MGVADLSYYEFSVLILEFGSKYSLLLSYVHLFVMFIDADLPEERHLSC